MLVSTGSITIVDVNDGLNATLTQSSLVVQCDTSGNVLSLNGVDTSMKVYIGGTDDSTNWSFYVSDIGSGITYCDSTDTSRRSGFGATDGSILGTLGYIKVNSFTAANTSYIQISAFKAGYDLVSQRLTLIKTKAGSRGSVSGYIGSQLVWSDSVANTYFASNYNNTFVVGDQITEFGAGFSQTKNWSGTAWALVNQVIDGSLIVTGSITAPAIAANTITLGSAIIQSGAIDDAKIANLSAGKLTAGSIAVGQTIQSAANSADGTSMWNITGDGVVNFKSGTFSGSLYGANITGTNGTFSGVLSAGSVDFTTSVGTTTNYNTAGTFAITVPANMTSMRINLMGGGGGGGGGGSYSNTGGGQGGFGSVLTIITLNGLTEGTRYTLVVGSGGTAGVNYVYPFGDTTYSDSYYETPTITQSTSGITSSLILAASPYTSIAASVGGSGGSVYMDASPYTGATGTHTGTSGTGTGGGVAAIDKSSTAGSAGTTNSGGGGGGGYGNDSTGPATSGGAGGTGRALLEFFNSSGVVLRAEMATLKGELRNQGLTIS